MAVFRKTTETFTGGKTLAQRYFISPEIFEREREQIFSKQWVCAGHQSQIAEKGDYIVEEVAGESLIILREARQVITGFYNVCRHRGTRLCTAHSGRFKEIIQCPYHAWTYGLDGRLVGAPHMDAIEGFEKGDYPLRRVQLGMWEGFLFVNLAEDAAPLETAFAPLIGKFREWNLPILRSARRTTYEVGANWKLIFENYSECYHCPLVHPVLSRLSPYDAAENDLSEGPFLGGFMPINQGRSLTMSGKACAIPLNRGGSLDQHQVFYYSIFPSMLLSLHPDYVMVHQIRPRSPGHSTIVCDWFFHPEAFDRADFHPEDAADFWDLTNREDWRVCELSQQGIASRAYQPGPFSPRESIPAAWDREYLRALGQGEA